MKEEGRRSKKGRDRRKKEVEKKMAKAKEVSGEPTGRKRGADIGKGRKGRKREDERKDEKREIIKGE